MKKISIIVLSLLLVCAFFSSCENNVAPVESKVAAVNFSVADGRGLQELKPDFIPVNDESLVWYYKADKTSDSNFKTGAASDWTLIGNDGKLTNKVIFSLGIWNIDLQARLADNTIMYEGSKVGIIIDDPNNTTTVSINVSASVSGQNGYIVLDDVYILEQNGTGRVAPNVLIVSVSGADSGTSYNLTDNENGTVDSDPISLAPGSYDVAVGYISGSIKNAGEIKTVQVYSGRTTTVTGYVDEMRGGVQFNPVADTGVAYPNAPVTDGSSTTFTVANVTPSGETAKSTKAVFEDGALSAGGNYKLSTSVSNEIEKGNFDISTGSNTVASLDLSLTNGTEVVSTFNNKTVTITTYIAKGLTGVTVTGPKEAEITIVNYNSETGELTFTTNHFSEYVVTTTGSYEAYNATTKKAYGNWVLAINEAVSGDHLMLIKDFETSERVTISNNRVVYFDFFGHTLTFNGGTNTGLRPFVIELGSSLIVNNSCVNPQEKGGINVVSDYTYGIFDVYGEIIINNGYFESNGINNGSLVRGRDGSSVVINNGKFYASGYDAVTFTNGSVLINDGVFISNSRSGSKDYDGKSNFSYCINHHGTDLTINGGKIYGIQGAIGIGEGTAVINYAEAYCRDLYSDNRAFYALYTAGESGYAECTVNGGVFVSDNISVWVSNTNTNGDGGINEHAAVTINGGYFESKKKEQDLQVSYALGQLEVNGGSFKHDKVYAMDTTETKELAGYLSKGHSLNYNEDEGRYIVQ